MDEKKIEHLKGLSVINITKFIMSKYQLSHEDAYKKVLTSETYKILMNNTKFISIGTVTFEFQLFLVT